MSIDLSFSNLGIVPSLIIGHAQRVRLGLFQVQLLLLEEFFPQVLPRVPMRFKVDCMLG